MIARLRRFVSERVGRRLFLLFILSAFLPLAALAALTYVELRDMMLLQGEQRLAATAKAYGMGLFERLMLASDLAATSVAPQAKIADNSLARRSFRSLARLYPDGRLVPVFGKPRAPALTVAHRDRLAEGRPVLVYTAKEGGHDLTLAVPAAGGGAIALAELAPDMLWAPEMLPASTDFCVVDEDTHAILYCSAWMPEVLWRVGTGKSQATLRARPWMRDGEVQRSVAWPQFLRIALDTPDWVVVASQPQSLQLQRLTDFQRIYIPVVALAILLVTWLTIRLSRSIVGPVTQLARQAGSISQNDFSGRLRMERRDEFGALAAAFDQMSERLGRQFAALTALSEIDQLILSTPDTAQVVRTVLERMGEVVPADFIGITLFDPENRDNAQAYFRDMRLNDGVVYARVSLEPGDREVLERNPGGEWIALGEGSRGVLGMLRQRDVRMAYVQPIVFRHEVCGALALGYREGAQASEEERQQAREFADRVAVAVSSAWRDEQLYTQAHFDPLTGLPNRLLFKDRLGQEVARCQREGRRFAVLFVDIDRFKAVNDTLGHTAGDEVLREAAQRISSCLRDSDTVSRLGGDEFTVLLSNIHLPQDAGRVADEVVRELSRAFLVGGQSTFLSASVGIATYPEDGTTSEELLKNSDTAMYRAKAGGRAMVVYFEEKMNAEAVARVTLDRDLRKAVDDGEVEMHYQPLLDLRTGEIRGAEALMRWQHPERGAISPSQFVPVAEESGFIDRLGEFALAEACAQVRAWRAEGLPVRRVSVNVSPRQLRKPGIVQTIRRTAADLGVGLDALEIEITEGLLIDHADSVEGLLRELDAGGARIALDDFGTGFSSMAYLNRFPIHTIKIDRVFIDGLGRSRDSEAIVVAIIAMAHALGKSVVAEGVETAGQIAFLENLRCDEIQGFFVAHPMPAAEFRQFVRAYRPIAMRANAR